MSIRNLVEYGDIDISHMSFDDNLQKDAYIEGVIAFHNGECVDMNPYSELDDEDLYHMWNDGFVYAESDNIL